MNSIIIVIISKQRLQNSNSRRVASTWVSKLNISEKKYRARIELKDMQRVYGRQYFLRSRAPVADNVTWQDTRW